MGRLTKLPVLGRLIRIGSAFVKGPKRFDYLYAQVERLQRELNAANSRNQALQQCVDDINARFQQQEYTLQLGRDHLRMHSRLLDHCQTQGEALLERFGKTEARIDEAEYRSEALLERFGKTEARIDDVEYRMADYDRHILKMLNVDSDYMKTFVDRICMTPDCLTDLNRELSGHPTIWGNAERLHIDETAAVFPCFFNTNSGSITVGKYTFAGSNVSLLAGTHEMHLQGYLRRNTEITKGCDIVVGDGVWLASGCTLLGPCTVGNNAVIAAGAVVTPGTHVPANTIYGGIPARKIAELDFQPAKDGDNPYLMRAFDRSDGLIMVSGWTNKRNYSGIAYAGHWLEGDAGVLLTDRRYWMMYYALEGADSANLLIEGSEGTIHYSLDGGIGVLSIEMPSVEGKPEMLSLRLEDSVGKLFVALTDRMEDR